MYRLRTFKTRKIFDKQSSEYRATVIKTIQIRQNTMFLVQKQLLPNLRDRHKWLRSGTLGSRPP